MTLRKATFLDKIGSLIPNYLGYSVRSEMRNTEKQFRDEISILIRNAETKIVSFQKQLISCNEIILCQQWEISRKLINTLYSQIKNASYGESPFFAENQIKDEELEIIYKYDLEISERVALISKTVESEIDEPLSAGFIKQQVIAIDSIIIDRTNFINRFK